MTDKITAYEEDVQDLIAASTKQPKITDGDDDDDEHAQHQGEGDEAGLDSDEDDDENEDHFIELEEDLANVIADVHDLGK